MPTVINGKELAAKVRLELKEQVAELKKQGIQPKLAVIMVGNDGASAVYVRNKSKACDEIGVAFEEFLLEEKTTREELLSLIEELNHREDVHGICTPAGVMKMLEEYNIETQGKNAVVIGRSNIVGKPLAQLLINSNATVTVCHSKTQNIAEIAKQADILVVAIRKTKICNRRYGKRRCSCY